MNAANPAPPAMRFVVFGDGDQATFCCPRCGAKEARLYAVDVDDGRVRVVMTEEHNRLEPGMVSSFALMPPRELRVVMHFVCSAGHDFFYRYRVRDKRTFVTLDVDDAAQDAAAGEGTKEAA